MQPLSAAQLFDVWEKGQAKSLVERALLLLAASCPESPGNSVARISIGQRDGCLLTLREWTFGPYFAGQTNCPDCGELVEATFMSADVRTDPPTDAPDLLALEDGDYEVQFRLPDSVDLLAASAASEVEAARHLLFERCLIAARYRGGPIAGSELPVGVVEDVGKRMAHADPQADVYLALKCPACARSWRVAFDIVAIFWDEIEGWIRRILREVHTLASAYGWREADILALSPQRRRIYLDMVSR